MTALELATPDGRCDATLHRTPDRPGVILFMDVFGPRPRVTEMAETISSRGFRVLVPNLFYRRARPPYADPMALLRAHTFDDYLRDAPAFLDVFAGNRVRLVGYCLGGHVGLRVAAAHPDRVAAVASFHAGQLVTDQPDSPHRQLVRVTADVYVGHADEDPSMTPEQQRLFGEGLTPPRQRAELYAGARHGFTMADRPVFDRAACDRHWTELFTLFTRVEA